MLAKVKSCAVIGLACEQVEVEVDISQALPSFIIVGLPDKAVDESKERVKSALKNTGLTFPRTKITVNLAPADLRKAGPAYDLPIALGILAASQQLTPHPFEGAMFVGELALDGRLRQTNGILPITLYAKSLGIKRLYIPAVNTNEAALVDGIEVLPAQTLAEVVLDITGQKKLKPVEKLNWQNLKTEAKSDLDMSFIKGQEQAKRALEIAAAGGHNLLLSGSPGAGKTMLAKALPSILPPLSEAEILEVTKIYSVAGALSSQSPLVVKRPFRSPHHSASAVALIGGGSFPKPGEISLAHRGVLFMDEFSEFPRHVLEHLRQPLEDGVVTVARAQGTVSFPARFTLVASQNPCPCGWRHDPQHQCVCTPTQIARYHKKISGPILDRIDMYVEVPPVQLEKLTTEELAESSDNIRARVIAARQRQQARYQSLTIETNAEMSNKEIKEFCRLSDSCLGLIRQAVRQFRLSARSYFRLLKLARTIADLAGEIKIAENHVSEALTFRPRLEVIN